MNQDDSPISPPLGADGRSLFELGDYRYKRNLRNHSTITDQIGADENIAGTTEVSNYYTWYGSAWVSSAVPSGTKTAIGKFEDVDEARIYWAVYNTAGNHAIMMFDKNERKIYELLKWSGLNFQAGSFVSMSKIDKWLLLADRMNGNRLIDVESIFSLKQTLGSAFIENNLAYPRYPPLMPPVLLYDSTLTVNSDYDYVHALTQVAYRYVYQGGFTTPFSCHSSIATFVNADVALTARNIKILIPGTTGGSTTLHDTAPFYQQVDYIEIAYRESSIDLWKIFKRHKVVQATGTSNIIFTFSLSGDNTPIASKDFFKLFESAPLISGAVTNADNRFILGDNKEETEYASDFAVDNVTVYTRAQSGSSGRENSCWLDPSSAGFTGLSTEAKNYLANLNAIRWTSFKSRGLYKLGFVFQLTGGRESLTYSPDNLLVKIPDTTASQASVYETEPLYAIGFNIPSGIKPPIDAVSYKVVRTNCLNMAMFGEAFCNKFLYLADDAATPRSNSVVTMDSAVQTIVNDFYNSQGISGNVLPTSDLAQNPDFLNFVNSLPSSALAGVTSSVFASVAKSTNGDIRKITPADFQNLKAVTPFPGRLTVAQRVLNFIRSTKGISTIANASKIYIDINNWYSAAQYTTDHDFPLNKLYYEYQEGDRVRFYGSKSPGPSLSEISVYDLPIVGFDGRGIIAERPSDLVWLPSRTFDGNHTTSNSLSQMFKIEVYRPKKPDLEDLTFYECGEWYPVKNAGTSSRSFSKTDWRWTNEASVGLGSITIGSSPSTVFFFSKLPVFYGDCHRLQKTIYYDRADPVYHPGNDLSNCRITSMNPDKDQVFGRWEKNNGRPSTGYRYIPSTDFKVTQVRFSGKFLEDAVINNLCSFDEPNQKILPLTMGRIRSLTNTTNAQVESAGEIILVNGESEPLSVYVNRTILEDLGGRQQVSLADQVLGSYNVLKGGNGCLNPESIGIDPGRVTWWDAKKGTWCRYGRDGITETSREYKMKTWFKDLSVLLRGTYSSTPAKALSVWDEYNQEWLTLLDHSSLPSTFRGYSTYKCVSFAEDDTRWKSVFDYTADLFAAMDNEVYSIQGRKVFIHGDNQAAFNTFYGTKYDSEVEHVANMEYLSKKVWYSQGHVATDPWSFTSIKGDWLSNGATRQETYINLADLKNIEDMYWAEFDRDINTLNKLNASDAKITGDAMRSRALYLRMKLDPSVTWQSLLYWLCVYYDLSEKTPKIQ